MVLIVVETVPASRKPPAGVDVHISPDEKHGSGTSVPSSTKISSLHIGKTEGSVMSSPKLV